MQFASAQVNTDRTQFSKSYATRDRSPIMKRNTAITGLRVLSGLVMLVGLAGIVDGFVRPVSIPLFAFDVPTWVIGATAAYLGLRYWRRIPAMEKQIDQGN